VRTTLATFTNTAGAVPGNSPVGGIVQSSDGLIYGTTSSGGTGGGWHGLEDHDGRDVHLTCFVHRGDARDFAADTDGAAFER